MTKRITSIVIVMVMVFSVIGFTTTKAEAATAPAYVMLKDVRWDYNKIKEKVGDYYIWIDNADGAKYQKLKCSKLLGVQPKVLKSVAVSSKKEILRSFVTNGNVIYYAVGQHGKYLDSFDSITIYKTNVKGTTNVEVKTLKNIHSLVGCYNGKLYYTGLIEGFYEGSLYSMDLSTKKTKLVKKGMGALACNANNIIMWGEKNLVRYNVANKKTVVMPFETDDATIIGNKIYYADDAVRYYEDEDVPADVGTAIYRTDLNGKNKKMVAEFIYDGGFMAHFGHKNAYFVKESGRINRYNFNNDAMYRYVAFLGKTTLNSVKSSGDKAVTVSWKKVANAGKYQVYRATAKNGTYKLVKTTTATSWKNTGLTTGKTYYYKVRAINGDTRGAYSAVKYAKPVLGKVTNVNGKATINSATLSWNKVNGAKGYQVFRSTSKNGKYVKVKTVTGTKFTNNNLEKKTYYYKVRAYKIVNGGTKYGAFSKIVSCNVGSLDVIRANMLKKVNAERAKAGAKPLKLYAAVNKTAQIKAKDLYNTGNFDHYSKNLGYFYDQYESAGLTYSAGGENIAAGQGSVAAVMNSWMNSKGHKENILNKQYTHIGIGYYNGYWVQQFISDPVKRITGDYFDCPHCGAKVSFKDDLLYTDGTAFWCDSCDHPIWMCLQCNNGFYKNVGIEKEEQWNAGRCNNCGRNQYKEFVEFCQKCKTPIWDNYYQDNYVVSFRYPEEDKPIMQEFSVSTFACKSCKQYVLASYGDFYSEKYAELKEMLEPGQDIYDYIIWNKEVGWKDIDEDTTEIIMGPDERWELADLDDIVNMKYPK